MSSFDIIGMALRNLFKRKLRTFLTILGVIIGTTAIIIMISLGIGMNENFIRTLESMGDLTIINVRKPYDYNEVAYSRGGAVMISSSSSSSSSSRNSDGVLLDDNAVENFRRIDGVVAATPFLEIYLKAVSGKFQSYIQIRGLDPEAMEVLGYIPKEGRLLAADDKLAVVYGAESVFRFHNPYSRDRYGYYGGMEGESERVPDVNVLEDKVQASFDWSFGEKNPNYQQEAARQVKPYTLKGVGILQTKGWDYDGYVYMNIKEVQKIKDAQEKYEQSQRQGSGSQQNQSKGYEMALVKCGDIKVVQAIQEKIVAMGYEAYSLSDNLKSMQEMSNSLQALLGAIGGVSLFVAAIGISNTMIMSIYERTREIGIMKVIGASIKDIKKLFLLEAALIGVIGGVFGVVFSLIVSKIINSVGISFFSMMSYGNDTGGVSSIPVWLCMAALGFSAAIGLVSGYFPARRAMKLSALSAIRTE